jgi:hypothetical protein|tara:strand:+ start:1361 stop:1546 length:186 start_codon:yes stop_codon:yes gene_type:complete
MTTMTMIHNVKTIKLYEPKQSMSQAGLFWARKLNVIDNNGNETQITLFAATEEQLEIKETT